MKGILSKILLLMTLISLAALGVVLVQSLTPSERALNEAEYVLKVEPIGVHYRFVKITVIA